MSKCLKCGKDLPEFSFEKYGRLDSVICPHCGAKLEIEYESDGNGEDWMAFGAWYWWPIRVMGGT